jgi:hypothetical protein
MSQADARPSLTDFFQQTVSEFDGEVEKLGDFAIERAAALISGARDAAAGE